MQIYIGYDSKEVIAYHVLAQSIISRASWPVALIPLKLDQLSRIYTRQRGPTESTEFSMTRFLVPYLSDYQGYSVFIDCDMLCQDNIIQLMQRVDPEKAVSVCQHEYMPKGTIKFLGQPQTAYPRKNWSSLIVFNNAKCRQLTPEYVNSASGLELHRFQWLTDDEIGSLPLTWNWLVGEYEPNPSTKILHYTLGGPWFPESRACDQAELWFDELAKLTGSV